MSSSASDDEGPRIFSDEAHRRARETMYGVANGLVDQGLDVLGQEWEEAHYLKAVNAWGALCDATIGADGTFTWDYRAADPARTDPAQIADIAMTLLAFGTHDDAAALTLRCPGQSFKSAVGLTARARGALVRLTEVIADPQFLEVSANVEITNPARSERGAVRVRDNLLQWECRLAAPDSVGLSVTEITETIGRSVPQLKVLNASIAPG
jgi:hypothetical protein